MSESGARVVPKSLIEEVAPKRALITSRANLLAGDRA